MNKFFYRTGNEVKRISLPIGEFSSITKVKIELIDSCVSSNSLMMDDISFIASPDSIEKRFFFSSRNSMINYKISLNERIFNYLEIKGCGKPHFGISPNKYFLEDGRDKDLVHDPIGGYSLVKALSEWKILKELDNFGLKTQVPILIARFKDVKGPSGEDLALLVKTGESNIRWGYFKNTPEKIKKALRTNYNTILDYNLFHVGDSLRKMHKIKRKCHNALHEENITLNGEIMDLEYVSNSTNELIYRDLWYVLLSFAEVFGVPLNMEKFVEGYVGKKKKLILGNKKKENLEKEAKDIAELLI